MFSFKEYLNETWSQQSAEAITRGLHKRPFSKLIDIERYRLGIDSKFLANEGFELTDEHVNDPQFMRGYTGKKFIPTSK